MSPSKGRQRTRAKQPASRKRARASEKSKIASEDVTPRAQLDIFDRLGPSVGIELRALLEDSDPRRVYPGLFGVIFGEPWPAVPGPRALTKTHLRQMAGQVREAVKRLHPRLLERFRELAAQLQQSDLDVLTRYRMWLAIRFLVGAQGHSEAVAAFRISARRLMSKSRRERIASAVERLRRTLVAPPRNSPEIPIPAIAYGWPPELRRLAQILTDLERLPKILLEYVEEAEVRLICEEVPPGQSTVRDPALHVAVRGLDRVLELDHKRLSARARRELIRQILDAVYPVDYIYIYIRTFLKSTHKLREVRFFQNCGS